MDFTLPMKGTYTKCFWGWNGGPPRENVEYTGNVALPVSMYLHKSKSVVLGFPSSHRHPLRKLALKNSTESEDCTV